MKKIICISGPQGSGKSAVAEQLKSIAFNEGFHPMIFKYADPLYCIHDAILPLLKQMGIRPIEMTKDGDLLQTLGTEYGRNKIDVNLWAKICCKRVIDYLESFPDMAIFKENPRIAIIDDCRFENEFDAFPDACHIRLDAPAQIRQQRVSFWRDERHESETGLNNYVRQGKYHTQNSAIFSTHHASPEITARAIWEGFQKGFKS